MKLFLLDVDNRQPLLDLLSGKTQIFQGPLPNFRLFQSKSQSKATGFFVPHDSKHWTQKYLEYVTKVSMEKPVVYMNGSDTPTRHNIGNSFSLQHTIPIDFPITQNIVIPYNIQSLEFLPFRAYGIPSVSFVGFAPRVSPKRVLKSFVLSPLHPLKSNGALIRKVGLQRLSRVPNAFIKRRTYYGGAKSIIPSLEIHREEFIHATNNSDFVFSPRGDANGSQRFFEALSCGRIPIVPQTNVFLPRVIDSDRKPFFLNIRTLSSNLAEKIEDFWESLNDLTYKEIQSHNRKLFASHLNYSTYMSNLLFADCFESWTPFLATNKQSHGGL